MCIETALFDRSIYVTLSRKNLIDKLDFVSRNYSQNMINISRTLYVPSTAK